MKFLEEKKKKPKLDCVRMVRCDNSAVHIENGNLDRQISEELATLSLKQHRVQADRNLEIFAARMKIRDHQERMKIMRAMRATSAPNYRSPDGVGLPSVANLAKTAEKETLTLSARSSSSRPRTTKATGRSVTFNLTTVGEKDGGVPVLASANQDISSDTEDTSDKEQKDSDNDDEGKGHGDEDVAIIHRVLPLHQNMGSRALTTARSRRQMDESSRPMSQGHGQLQGQRPHTSAGGPGAEHTRHRRLLTLGQMMHMDDDAMTVQQLRQTHRIDVRVEQEREKRRLTVLERRKTLHAQRTIVLLERLRAFCLALDNMKPPKPVLDMSAII